MIIGIQSILSELSRSFRCGLDAFCKAKERFLARMTDCSDTDVEKSGRDRLQLLHHVACLAGRITAIGVERFFCIGARGSFIAQHRRHPIGSEPQVRSILPVAPESIVGL